MRSSRGIGVALVVCLAASACSSEPTGDGSANAGGDESIPPGVDGPVVRHRQPYANEGLTAEIAGSIELEGDCLYLRSLEGDYRYPIVWPAGTTWDETQLSVMTAEGELILVGSTVSGGGGYLNLSHVEEIAGAEAGALAESCLDNEYDEIAVVNNEASGIRISAD